MERLRNHRAISNRSGGLCARPARRQAPKIMRALNQNSLSLWRKRVGWTQKQAAAYLDVSLRTYQNWEQGRKIEQPGPIRKLMKLVWSSSAAAEVERETKERA